MVDTTSLEIFSTILTIGLLLGALVINFIGWKLKIGLLQILAFLMTIIAIPMDLQLWESFWPLPFMLVMANAIVFITGINSMRNN